MELTVEDGNRYLSPGKVMTTRFSNNDIPLWKIAILCFRDSVGCEVLINKYKAKPFGNYKVFYGIDAHESEQQIFEAEINGVKVGIITRLCWGGPQAAILVEELSYLGVQNIIGYGEAGSIKAGIPKGSQIVAIKGLVSDGTSKSYIKDKLLIGCNNELLDILRDNVKYKILEVCAANIDALYRETHELIKCYQSEGAEVVNLETSAMYAASEVCNVRAIWIGYISDSLVDEKWEDWNNKSINSSDICAEISIKLIEGLIEKDNVK
jgi:uridine phosphorylase